MNKADINYSPDVKFQGRISSYNNCVCDGCHKTDFVLKLTLPETRYNDSGILETKYFNYWLCDDCFNKFGAALEGAAKNG